VAARLHLRPGQQLPFTQDGSRLELSAPLDHLARIYVEPTNQCNFDCRTCMRSVWDEPSGLMTWDTFTQVLEALKQMTPAPMVFFGGFGEPLVHPQIFQMIAAVKQLGAKVELISNGSLLNETAAGELVRCGLDRLWVSLDGASPECYADIRLGDAFPQVLRNLEGLAQARREAVADIPALGIAFVAMKRNIHELPEIIRLGRQLGADHFSISNVLAHTPELRDEVLYQHAYYETDQPVSRWAPLIQLPRMELNALTGAALAAALQGRASVSVAGQVLSQGGDTCPFLEKRSLSVRWDGEVSPCLPLLHNHTSYLDDTYRKVQAVSYGNLNAQSLEEIWRSAGFHALREQLSLFDFSPCVFCNSCENAEGNQEDCFGSTFPACGGCLWAQGFIQCP
jgi:MoaA/NifB/PqqE/SkfB family radical SAM enzyme